MTDDVPDRTKRYSTGTLWAEPAVVYWQSTDLSKFPSEYASSLMPKMGLYRYPAVSASLVSYTNDPTAPTVVESAAMKAGAIAGTAVGCAGIASVLIGLMILRCLKRRRARQAFATRQGAAFEISGQPSVFRRFIGGKRPVEIDSKPSLAEMESRQAPIEIDTKIRGAPFLIAELEAPMYAPDSDKFSFVESQFDTREIGTRDVEGPFLDERSSIETCWN